MIFLSPAQVYPIIRVSTNLNKGDPQGKQSKIVPIQNKEKGAAQQKKGELRRQLRTPWEKRHRMVALFFFSPPASKKKDEVSTFFVFLHSPNQPRKAT